MLSIVVVTHNRLDYTKQCLNNIIKNTDVKSELIIVDSDSTDKTYQWLRNFLICSELKDHGIMRIMAHELGYNSCADAYNWGFEHAGGDIVVRIDNDILVPANWASHMKNNLNSDEKLGMLTTDLITDLSKEQPRCSDSPRVTYFNDTVWHDRGLGSWCMGIKKQLFNEVGFYRSLYGTYALQDNDLEKRAMNAGWKIGTLSGVRVGHLYSMITSEEMEYNKWKQEEYNRQIETWNSVWGLE